jgi:hypothetical protein
MTSLMNRYIAGPIKFVLFSAVEGLHKLHVGLVLECLIFGGSKVVRSEGKVRRASVAPSFECLDPVKCIGVVERVTNDLSHFDVIFAVSQVRMWHASDHFLLDSPVVSGRVLEGW